MPYLRVVPCRSTRESNKNLARKFGFTEHLFRNGAEIFGEFSQILNSRSFGDLLLGCEHTYKIHTYRLIYVCLLLRSRGYVQPLATSEHWLPLFDVQLRQRPAFEHSAILPSQPHKNFFRCRA